MILDTHQRTKSIKMNPHFSMILLILCMMNYHLIVQKRHILAIIAGLIRILVKIDGMFL